MSNNSNSVSKYYKSLNVFEVSGYCAVVPIPPPRINFSYLFDAYDWMSWMFMVISLTALAIIWKIFKAHRDSENISSAGRMVFLVVAVFLGQAFEFRHSRWFHLLVIQLYIFMVVILGNAYQSLLIAEVTVQRNTSRMKTVDELMNGDFNFITDKIFYHSILKYHPTLRERFTFTNHNHILLNYRGAAANNSVLVMRCDIAEGLMTIKSELMGVNGLLAEFYYILPEKLFTVYEKLMTSRFCPFTERFEEFSLRIFESGIKQYWKIMIRKIISRLTPKQHVKFVDEHLLDLNELTFIFIILAVGLVAGLVVLLIELIVEKKREAVKRFLKRLTKKLKLGDEKRRKKMENGIEEMRIRRLETIIDLETLEIVNCG
jgi:hypothetical protein